MQEREGQFVELQSIRALLAPVVLIEHCLGYFRTAEWVDTVRWALNDEALLVTFFTMSGYLMALAVLKRDEQGKNSATDFYVRRLFRLYPTILAASALSLAYLLTLHYGRPIPGASEWMLDRFQEDRMTVLHLAASAAGLLAFLLPPLWTNSAELAGSALMPWLPHLIRRRLFWVTLAALGIVSVLVGSSTYYGVGLYLVDFMIGAAVCVLPTWVGERLRASKRLAYGVLLIAFVTLAFSGMILPEGHHRPTQILASLGAAAILTCITTGSVDLPFLRTKFGTFMGDIGFAMYLLHFPVMCLIAWPLALTTLGSEAKAFTLAGLTLATTIPLSYLSYRYVEMPGQRLGKWFLAQRWSAWLSQPRSTQTTA
ncbi:acyltransferase [Phenylobacterium sp. J426]|uniref:acyltransferase family protein n=1 Tax=Phenylobacterium sp. J426 TaxID=2898439 RepID=UPI002151A1EA|nr:acyltransferase [Phenylobacterium sp. J426]MCR5874355.1 acyltransferase [Phenylobacterium sp. J426]